MAQSFIRDHDFVSAIRTEQLTKIIEGESSIKNDAIAASETEIKSYLRAKYDIDAIFQSISDYDVAVAYSHGDVVHDLANPGNYYTAIGDVTAGTALSDDTKWTLGDPRDKLIVEFMIDLILYRIHSRVSPNQIPTHRIDRRDDAISFLKSAAKYNVTVGWQQLESKSSITWGSNTKETKLY